MQLGMAMLLVVGKEFSVQTLTKTLIVAILMAGIALVLIVGSILERSPQPPMPTTVSQLLTPTATVTATVTPSPTTTPSPTFTPQPSDTPRPLPTMTPVPTFTSTVTTAPTSIQTSDGSGQAQQVYQEPVEQRPVYQVPVDEAPQPAYVEPQPVYQQPANEPAPSYEEPAPDTGSGCGACQAPSTYVPPAPYVPSNIAPELQPEQTPTPVF